MQSNSFEKELFSNQNSTEEHFSPKNHINKKKCSFDELAEDHKYYEYYLKIDEIYENEVRSIDVLIGKSSEFSCKLNDIEISLKKRKSKNENREMKSNIFWKNSPYKNIIFNPLASKKIFFSHLTHICNGLIYSKYFLQQPNPKSNEKRLVKLIPSSIFIIFLFSPNKLFFFTDRTQKVLFFELENTLLASNLHRESADCFINKNNQNRHSSHVFSFLSFILFKIFFKQKLTFQLRPYCIESLQLLSKYFDLYIFTSVSEECASAMMNFIDPKRTLFAGVLSRKHCLKTSKGFYIKDLRIIINKTLNDIIIVDKFVHSFAFQIDNGIPILPWKDDPLDCELSYLTKYLIDLAQFSDFRIVNRNYLKLSEMAVKICK